MPAPRIDARPQLLTYPDSLGGDLGTLAELLDGPLSGLFRGVHVLPPFPSSGDRGFAPLTYDRIDPRFGSWSDVERIAADHDVLLDVMINHISRASPEFLDFQQNGRASASADLFLTLDKVWPGGLPRDEDVAQLFLRKPGGPFSTVTIESTGKPERIWTTFGTAEWSEQVDLDVSAPATRELTAAWLGSLASHGVRIVRLDAVGYVVKKPGTTSFMVEPEIYDFLDWIAGVAATIGLLVLPEIHDLYATHTRLSQHGHWTYDFVLPGLVLQAFATGDAKRLATHLDGSPARQFTTLDCHDGIPVRPDLDGILTESEMRDLAARVQAGGGNVNRMLSHKPADGVDVHQLNSTYYSALSCDDDRYVAARAIQLFAKGVPQVYYVGLLAGENDDEAVRRTLDGRAINRHDFTLDEITAALRRPVVERIVDLVRLRNTHPAFEGDMCAQTTTDGVMRLEWQGSADHLYLEVDFAGRRAAIIDGAARTPVANWQA
ncbi:MAG: sucrose phosphorylase [Chloroflexota bacterium]